MVHMSSDKEYLVLSVLLDRVSGLILSYHICVFFLLPFLPSPPSASSPPAICFSFFVMSPFAFVAVQQHCFDRSTSGTLCVHTACAKRSFLHRYKHVNIYMHI